MAVLLRAEAVHRARVLSAWTERIKGEREEPAKARRLPLVDDALSVSLRTGVDPGKLALARLRG